MNVIPEISTDLMAQDSTDPEPPAAPIEVDDICEFEPLIDPHKVANTDTHPAEPYDPFDDDTIEIELSAEQVDRVLSTHSMR